MTDIEMTRLCAEAMGFDGFQPCASGPFASDSMLTKRDTEQTVIYYDPLHIDAQAMALVKRLNITLIYNGPDCHSKWTAAPEGIDGPADWDADSDDLNRAIVECVSKMQAAKEKP